MSDDPVRRFYKETSVSEEAGGFSVLLDARKLKTRSGAVFIAPSRALAEACAKEWDEQDKQIRPETMPMTRFVNVALDITRPKRADIVAHVVKYMGTDLLCHRAESPAALAEKQAETWDPILAWAKAKHGLEPPVVAGILAADAGAAQEKMQAIAEALDDFALTALAHNVGLLGSAILGLALLEGELDPEKAFQAAALDDLWSLERWGEDEEARKRLDRLGAEIREAAAFGRLIQA
jgi:chaperone required for assembly of F1-ATPase